MHRSDRNETLQFFYQLTHSTTIFHTKKIHSFTLNNFQKIIFRKTKKTDLFLSVLPLRSTFPLSTKNLLTLCLLYEITYLTGIFNLYSPKPFSFWLKSLNRCWLVHSLCVCQHFMRKAKQKLCSSTENGFILNHLA